MKPSTAVEIVGFGLLVAAAFHWCLIAGLCAAGVALLLIGYAMDDDAADAFLSRMVAPVTGVVTRRRARRLARREERIGSKA